MSYKLTQKYNIGDVVKIKSEGLGKWKEMTIIGYNFGLDGKRYYRMAEDGGKNNVIDKYINKKIGTADLEKLSNIFQK